jgi:hypothetical protein
MSEHDDNPADGAAHNKRHFSGEISITTTDAGEILCRTNCNADVHGLGHAIGAILLALFDGNPRDKPAEWVLFQLQINAGMACTIRNATSENLGSGRAH